MSFPKVSVEGDLSALPVQLVELVNEHFPFVSINQDKKKATLESESDDEKPHEHRHHRAHHRQHDGAWAHGMGFKGKHGHHGHGGRFGAGSHHGHGKGFPAPPPFGPDDAESSFKPDFFAPPEGFPYHGKGERGGFCKRGGKGMKAGRCCKGKGSSSSDGEGSAFGRSFGWGGPWAGPCFGPYEGERHHKHGRQGRRGFRSFGWEKDDDETDNYEAPSIKTIDGQTISIKYDHAVGGYKVPIDIHENEDSFLLVLSLPGVKKEEIFIDYSSADNELSFAGCIVDISDAQKYTKISNTRSLGHFSSKVKLPSSIPIDESSIKAKSSNGVLKVYVMKDLSATKSTRVSVEQGGDSSEESDELDSVAAQTERTTLNEKNEDDDPSESTPGAEDDDAVVVDVDVDVE